MRDDQKHESLAAHLRQAREQSGLSIRELAKQVGGVHHSYLARIENGETANPSTDLLQRLADVLNVDSADLLAYVNVTLPEPRAYFRRKFGVDAEEADVLARLIEEHQANKGKGGHYEDTN